MATLINGHQGSTLTKKMSQHQVIKEEAPSAKKAQKLAEYFSNKTILITGVTGFIGKVCLVRLVRSLGTCRRVYVMLRPKKGMTPQQRFNRMIGDAPFTFNKQKEGGDAAQQASPDWSKVVAIEGDMSRADLGLSDDAKAAVCEEVEIMFNIAASVAFDAPLKQNLRDNYLGASNLLHLATQLNRLESLVHVSTFYSNSHVPHIDEKVLPLERDCEKLAELIDWMPESVLDQIAPHIMEKRPNTYVITKAMAENLVQKYQGRLPIAIVRPSIVTPSVRDPAPGWVDNVNGPMGLGVLASLGILRNIDWNYWGVADFVPVDYVVNSMLAVAERTARLNGNGQQEIVVYNCSTSSLNPITWGQAFEVLRTESLQAPPYKMIRTPIHPPRHSRANPTAMKLTKLGEMFFAYFIDFILRILGQKPILTRLTARLHHGYEILLPFTTNQYTCSNDNLLAVYEEMDERDKEEFNFDMRTLDWKANFVASYYGARSRLLKEDISNVPAALFKMKILRVVEIILAIMFWASLAWLLYRLFA